MAKSTSLEVQRGGRWETLTASEAIEGGDRRGRCIECLEPVRVHKASSNGMAAHVEHLRRNPACPLSDGGRPKVSATLAALIKRETRAAPPSSAAHVPVTAENLGSWRRLLLRLFDQLDGRSNPTAGPGARLGALRDANRIPRHIAALMKVVLESRNAAEYDDRKLSQRQSDAVRNAWDAVCEWTTEQGLKL